MVKKSKNLKVRNLFPKIVIVKFVVDFFEKPHTVKEPVQKMEFKGPPPKKVRLREEQELNFDDLEDLVRSVESNSKYADIDLKFEKRKQENDPTTDNTEFLIDSTNIANTDALKALEEEDEAPILWEDVDVKDLKGDDTYLIG